MKVNSQDALNLGREVLKGHGDSWAKVHASGVRRADGVIVVKRSEEASKGGAERPLKRAKV
jgi:hypothetical protein